MCAMCCVIGASEQGGSGEFRSNTRVRNAEPRQARDDPVRHFLDRIAFQRHADHHPRRGKMHHLMPEQARIAHEARKEDQRIGRHDTLSWIAQA